MKKFEKYIYIVIALIFVAVIASGITYIVMDKQNDKTEIKDNEPSNKENENEKSEQITLSESELEEYLNYVPNNAITSAYEYESIDLKVIDKNLLKDTIIYNAMECLYNNNTCPYETGKEITLKIDLFPLYEGSTSNKYIPLTYVNNQSLKMYNTELGSLENAKSKDEIFIVGGMNFIYEDGRFLSLNGGGVTQRHMSVIKEYKKVNDELIIYEYAAIVYPEEGEDYVAVMEDYYTKHKTYLGMPCVESEKDYSCYFEDNYKDYSLYKHTFKKNNTGYYWYKTEVIK